jgi:hypothetical protein
MEKRTVKRTRVRLSPRSCGTIIVFNTVHQGMYQQLLRQIREMEEEAKNPESIPIKIETFTAFGPFDNVIRFDVDDFCLVNRISSIAGVSSQQIQCAYTIWKPEISSSNDKGHWKPFCCITQLKVQNHLMLGNGPEIEEGIADVLAECMKQYLKENPDVAGDIEIELMATLGWDEFFIFMRNSRGYASMFEPILKKIRTLTLEDLKKHMGSEFPLKLPSDTPLKEKHLFLSTYSTPGYSLELSRYIEKKIETMRIEMGADEDFILPANELTLDELLKDKYPDLALMKAFGSETINVSTRLSIKPGHWPKVSRITRKVLEGTNWGFQDNVAVIERTFSIGRYDVYPWINAEMTCKEFVLTFMALAFALAGNLKKEEDNRKFLARTQYYNSYTVISYLNKESHPESSVEFKEIREGAFISQMGKISLGGKKKKTYSRCSGTG